MNNPINKLKEIFQEEKGVFIEERQDINTGRTTYGIIATRPIHLKETMRLYESGFRNEYIGSPARGQLVIIVGREIRN